MAAPTREEIYLLKAAQLARSAPQAWEQFTTALRGHLELLQDQQTDAPRAMLEIAQGRAQAVKKMLTDFLNIEAKASAIEQMLNKGEKR